MTIPRANARKETTASQRSRQSRAKSSEKRAVVTGGGSGIGKAISLALAAEGIKVAIIDVDVAAAEGVASQIRRRGQIGFVAEASVADATQMSNAFRDVDRQWGGVDILVNNAGVTVNKPTLDLLPEEWKRVVDINLSGVFHASQEAARRMVAQGGGSIVNIGSIYSLVAAPHRVAYCATKAGVAMMTQSLAIEWAKSGIRVNGVAPGYVHTKLTAQLVKQGRLDLESVAKRTPLNRLAEPSEIADAVLFLISEKAAFITGQVLAVDGGWTSYGYL